MAFPSHIGAHPELPPQWRLLVITGFLGGLTTFSSFSGEVVLLMRQDRLAMACASMALHLGGSLLLTFAGMATASLLRIQLCEPGEGGTPQRIFLDTHGEGVSHLGFTVPNLDAAEADSSSLGLAPWMRGRLPDRSGFTYFDTRDKGAGVTLEIRTNKRV